MHGFCRFFSFKNILLNMVVTGIAGSDLYGLFPKAISLSGH